MHCKFECYCVVFAKFEADKEQKEQNKNNIQ